MSPKKSLLIISSFLLFAFASTVDAVAINPSVSISNLSPGPSINVGQTVIWNTFPSGFANPVYSVYDSTLTSSITSRNINPSGGFSWTPISQDVGSHDITVYVTDSAGNSASANQTITVGAMATATISSLTPGTTFFPRQNVGFTITTTGFTNPSYSITDKYYGSSVSNSSISVNNSSQSSIGTFTWVPRQSDIGEHVLLIGISDSLGNKGSLEQKITVAGTGVTIGSINPGKTVSVGTHFSFVATTTGFVDPNFVVVDSFNGSNITRSLGTSTLFSWMPTIADSGVHSITVFATDSLGNNSNTNILVVVNNSPISQTNPSTINPTSATINSYIFTKAMALGSRGKDVTELQQRLVSLKLYSGPITGYFGTLTRTAVKNFQIKYNISPLGNVGPQTRSALNKLLNN